MSDSYFFSVWVRVWTVDSPISLLEGCSLAISGSFYKLVRLGWRKRWVFYGICWWDWLRGRF